MSDKEKFVPDEELEKADASLIWGEGYPTAENYSAGWACKNSDCKRYGKNLARARDVNDFFDVIVGVQKPPANMQKPKKPYIAICECPECFEKFWFHIGDNLAELIDERIRDGGSPQKSKSEQ